MQILCQVSFCRLNGLWRCMMQPLGQQLEIRVPSYTGSSIMSPPAPINKIPDLETMWEVHPAPANYLPRFRWYTSIPCSDSPWPEGDACTFNQCQGLVFLLPLPWGCPMPAWCTELLSSCFQLQDEVVTRETVDKERDMLIRRICLVQKRSFYFSFIFILCFWGLPFTILANLLGKDVSFSNMNCILNFFLPSGICCSNAWWSTESQSYLQESWFLPRGRYCCRHRPPFLTASNRNCWRVYSIIFLFIYSCVYSIGTFNGHQLAP
jgi:hypothetical protein